jgi:hypothetical protein
VVLAAECDGEHLVDQLAAHDHAHGAIRVVAPLVGDRLSRYIFGDDRTTRPAAEHRLAEAIGAFAHHGIDATGGTGDADPLQAIADESVTFHPDELLLVVHPSKRREWYEKHLPERVAERFALPVQTVEAIPILRFAQP